ncbi:SDR family oxidoreductase [Amycolatopsis sp. NPDC051061]|uniref:SDR family NAD(P)-dependent oxidoreductase n=1 Tax=Amycolatopsis sp. NPDC051061 TaxID=3155042 RepID=UPI00341FB46A
MSGGTGDLGAEVVRTLAGSGHEVWFQYRSGTDAATALADETGAKPFQADYTRIDELTDAEVLPPGGFDVLVCCAGVNLGREKLADVPADTLRRTLAVNVLSAVRLTQACLPAMTAAGHGRIVYLSSIFGQVAAPGNAPYNLTKSALRGLCQSVVADYAGSGVTANEILAGPVDSTMYRTVAADRARALGRDPAVLEAAMVKRIPARRLGTPSDVAHAVGYLVSAEASYVNGVALRVDGGVLSVL